MVKKFSEIHASSKKCLWLEYYDDEPNLEKWLNGLHEGRSHYYLINEATTQGWSVFAVDGIGNGHRDDYMAKSIAKTIQNGQCEKGISVNGNLHLSCTTAYPYKYCRDPNANGVFASLDKRFRTELKSMGMVKSIEILRFYTLKTKETDCALQQKIHSLYYLHSQKI